MARELYHFQRREDKRFGSNFWRACMALWYKGLEADFVPVQLAKRQDWPQWPEVGAGAVRGRWAVYSLFLNDCLLFRGFLWRPGKPARPIFRETPYLVGPELSTPITSCLDRPNG